MTVITSRGVCYDPSGAFTCVYFVSLCVCVLLLWLVVVHMSVTEFLLMSAACFLLLIKRK